MIVRAQMPVSKLLIIFFLQTGGGLELFAYLVLAAIRSKFAFLFKMGKIEIEPNLENRGGAKLSRILSHFILALLCIPSAFALEKIDPTKTPAQIDQYLFKDRVAEAARLANILVKEEPRNAQAWRRLALCQQLGQRPQEALVNINKALALAPGDIQIIAMRAGIYCALTRDDEALQDLRTVLADKTLSDVKVLIHCADMAKSLEDFELALQFADKALKQHPERPGLWALQGRAYWGLNKLPEADASMSKAVELKPDAAPNLEALIQIKSIRKDYAGVIALSELLNESHNLRATKLAELYRLVGDAYYQLRQYEKALNEYTLAIKANPNGRQHYRARAAVYAKLGEKEKEKADLALMKEMEDTFSPLKSSGRDSHK